MKQTTAIEFNDLAKPIRSWLASARNTDFLIEFNRKLGIDGIQRTILPELVYRIATLNLEPRDLVSEIALQLNLSDSSARIVAQELEKNVFHEVETVLREELGIDISQLHFGRDLGPLPQVIQAPRIIPVQVLPPKILPMQTEKYIEVAKPTLEHENSEALKHENIKTLKQGEQSGPFILHAEKVEIKPQVSTQPSRPTFSIKIPITQKKYYSTPAPVVARIETPTSLEHENMKTLKQEDKPTPLPMKPLSEIVKTSTQEHENIKAQEQESEQNSTQGKKIVHYSSFYTKL